MPSVDWNALEHLERSVAQSPTSLNFAGVCRHDFAPPTAGSDAVQIALGQYPNLALDMV